MNQSTARAQEVRDLILAGAPKLQASVKNYPFRVRLMLACGLMLDAVKLLFARWGKVKGHERPAPVVFHSHPGAMASLTNKQRRAVRAARWSIRRAHWTALRNARLFDIHMQPYNAVRQDADSRSLLERFTAACRMTSDSAKMLCGRA